VKRLPVNPGLLRASGGVPLISHPISYQPEAAPVRWRPCVLLRRAELPNL